MFMHTEKKMRYAKRMDFSVFRDINDALSAEKTYKGLRGTKTAVGVLTSACGLIKKTPSRIRKSHHTWWPPVGMEIWSLFKIKT